MISGPRVQFLGDTMNWKNIGMSPKPFCPPKLDDLATICYTSGTTGTPKCVVFLWQGSYADPRQFYCKYFWFHSYYKVLSIRCYISYLPLAYIYERANQVMTVYLGVAVGFYQGIRITMGIQEFDRGEHGNPRLANIKDCNGVDEARCHDDSLEHTFDSIGLASNIACSYCFYRQ